MGHFRRTEEAGRFQTTGNEVSEDRSGQRRGLLLDPKSISSSFLVEVSQLTGPPRSVPALPSFQSTVPENKVPGSCQSGSLPPIQGNPKTAGALGVRWR